MNFQMNFNLIISKISKNEKWVFLIASFLNIYHLFILSFIPSLDGPQHLYISNVIVNILGSNDLINQFFRINHIIVGNWIGHFLLSFYNYFFPATIAEKLLLTTYYFGIAYSFRYLVISIKGKSSFLSFIIFPFSTTTMVLLGYYNYSLGTIVFFLALGYWVRIEQLEMNTKRFFSMMALFILLFLSHVFVFMLSGLVFALYFVLSFVLNYVKSNNRRSVVQNQLRKLTFLFIAALPAILLWINYSLVVTKLGGVIIKDYSFFELTDYLVIIRSLMAFHREYESPANVNLFILINLIIVFSIIYRLILFKRKKKNTEPSGVFFRISDFWLIISFVFLILYYTFPDQLGSGNITNRISIVMFFILITWIAVQDIPKWSALFFACLFIIITIEQRLAVFKSLSGLDRDIVELKELDRYIDNNSIIVTLGDNGNWIEPHFPFYLGIDKSLVFLTNPQCSGQFPVVWNNQKIPPVFFGKRNINEIKTTYLGISGDNYIEKKIRFADYALVTRPDIFFRNGKNKLIIEVLEKYYVKIDITSRKNYVIFKFKKSIYINELINKIKNDENWYSAIKKKAKSRNISIDNMLLFDALYFSEKYN